MIYLKVIKGRIAVNMEARVVNKPQFLDEAFSLLKTSKLPYQDIKLDKNLFVSYHDEDHYLIGFGGLEFYSSYALLRSVAVKEELRGKAIGTSIVNDLLDRAKTNSVKEVYLLTETAYDFFSKRGFVEIWRENVPGEVKASSEFTSVCPVSAACMVYRF